MRFLAAAHGLCRVCVVLCVRCCVLVYLVCLLFVGCWLLCFSCVLVMSCSLFAVFCPGCLFLLALFMFVLVCCDVCFLFVFSLFVCCVLCMQIRFTYVQTVFLLIAALAISIQLFRVSRVFRTHTNAKNVRLSMVIHVAMWLSATTQGCASAVRLYCYENNKDLRSGACFSYIYGNTGVRLFMATIPTACWFGATCLFLVSLVRAYVATVRLPDAGKLEKQFLNFLVVSWVVFFFSDCISAFVGPYTTNDIDASLVGMFDLFFVVLCCCFVCLFCLVCLFCSGMFVCLCVYSYVLVFFFLAAAGYVVLAAFGSLFYGYKLSREGSCCWLVCCLFVCVCLLFWSVFMCFAVKRFAQDERMKKVCC